MESCQLAVAKTKTESDCCVFWQDYMSSATNHVRHMGRTVRDSHLAFTVRVEVIRIALFWVEREL